MDSNLRVDSRVDWCFWNTVFYFLICSSSIWSPLRNPVVFYKHRSISINFSSAFHSGFCCGENYLSYCCGLLCRYPFIPCASCVSVCVSSKCLAFGKGRKDTFGVQSLTAADVLCPVFQLLTSCLPACRLLSSNPKALRLLLLPLCKLFFFSLSSCWNMFSIPTPR